MQFDRLIQNIAQTHQQTCGYAAKAVNTALTLRNWLIGAYIHEYELNGEDRANYAERLVESLAQALKQRGVPTCERVRLYEYRRFYLTYPQIRDALPDQIVRSLTVQFTAPENGKEIVRSVTVQSAPAFAFPGQFLLERLSYTHFGLLLTLAPPLKRAFYETECIKGNWSVRELKRQIGSLYFERSGLSKNPAKLSDLINVQTTPSDPQLFIRDPYVFDFLGLKASEVLPESNLEAALLEKLQAFLLELGHGFCFEARQKRLLIGGEHFFVDLVFYHRLLKCHVLVELKIGAFSHEHLGQLNTYVSWYRQNEMSEGDAPPIGILLCTDKNQALAEYALAGIDNQLFISKYQLELPSTDTLQRYLSEQNALLFATLTAP